MRELYEQIISVFWIAIHHRWAVAISAAIICFIGWGVVYLLPDKFEVGASIYFDQETALSPVLEGIATEDTSRDERAMIIQRTLTNRASLIEIAESNGVDLSNRTPRQVNKFLSKMYKQIKIENKRLSETNFDSAQNLYSIAFTHNDPQFALAVVNSILDMFIEKFIRTGDIGSDKVEGFLESNIAEYKAKLEEAEEKLKQFKQKHPNLTQAKGENFFTRLNQIKSDLETAKLSLLEEQNRNYTLRSQLNRVIADSQNSAGAEIKARELSVIEQRIQDVRQKLAELKLQFTDKHPDVQANERILRQLMEQKKQEDLNPTPIAPARKTSSLVNSELYQKLQLSVSESNSKVAALNARISEYQSKLDVMNEQISIMPEIESELVRLTRDYTVTKETYDSLVKRRSSTEMSREAERSSQELLYQILDEPALPTTPSFPNRRLFSALVFLLGIAGGLGIAWLLEQFNPKIYREQQIEDEFELQVYGNIPMYWSDTEIASRRIGAVFYSLFLIALFAIFISVMVYHGFKLDPYIEMVQDIFNQDAL